MKRTILALMLLTLPGWSWAQPVYEAVSKCLVIHLQEGIPSLKIQLSDDYTVARKADIKGNLMLCPWNEYFLFETSSVDLIQKTPVLDEVAMNKEVDAFVQSTGRPYTGRKVWLDAKGPRASLELVAGEKPKRTADTYLLWPAQGRLYIYFTTGYETSLADQKVIQDLILKELNRS